MRSRWFHVPTFHTDKKVSWLELFYDLVFVAAVLQLGDALSTGLERGEGLFAAAKFAGHFLPLWIAWTGFTYYANRFTVDDLPHRIFVFLQMFAVGGMAVASRQAMGPEPEPRHFAAAYGAAQLLLAAMQLRAWKQVPKARRYARWWCLVFGFGGACWLVSLALPRPHCYLLWALGGGGVFFAPISRPSRALAEEQPTDFQHLSERYGLLTIIVLGVSFVKVLSYLAASAEGTESYLAKGGFTLLITCCVWWVYFDDVAGSRLRAGAGSWIVWLYGHLPLGVGVAAVGVAIKETIELDLGTPPEPATAWLLAGSLSLTSFAVGMIDSVTERRQAELSDRHRVNMRVLCGVLFLVVGQVGSSTSASVFLAAIGAVCVAQVVFDIMMAPFQEHDPSLDAEPLRAQADRRAAGEEPENRPRRDVATVLRKGAPPELRRDLYFFFMEGSWTRALLSLVFCYLLVNVLFAGLYLIHPECIGLESTSAFRSAFAFSVQTISTIGYGGMSPQTAYGDMIVTIEAAVGLLGVALATGLMFAKASRPHSSVVFSRNVLVTTMNGKRVLMFRAGNARGNEVVEASLNLAVLQDEVSPEGHHLRRIRDLRLVRDRSPVFMLSWTVIHELDGDSPLAGVDWSAPEKHISNFVVTMMGHDATYGTTTHARHTYFPEDVLLDRRFVDVMSQLSDGRLLMDYDKFHDTEPSLADKQP
jgi:inward rectifier potassium channel